MTKPENATPMPPSETQCPHCPDGRARIEPALTYEQNGMYRAVYRCQTCGMRSARFSDVEGWWFDDDTNSPL